MNILVVEDEPNNMKLITIILKKHGHETKEAYTGKEGIEKAAFFQPDVILMDIRLPDMDGFEATRKIKEIENIRNVPVIALTSYSKDDTMEKAIKAGCCGFLEKPINPVTIMDDIKGIIGAGGSCKYW